MTEQDQTGERGTPLSDVFGPPDGTPDSWAEALAAEREHAAALVRELRHIATNCDHSPSRGVGEHIHEPTTGGSLYCGPCRAWRVLNGSPEAVFSGSSTLAEKHQAHYRSCGCLGDSAICCDPTCECHEASSDG